MPAYRAALNLGVVPAWRVGKTKDTLYEIANTASLNGCTGNVGTIDAWNGLIGTRDELFSFIAGGHTDSFENAVYRANLRRDAPGWTTVGKGSTVYSPTTGAYYSDGLPAARHTCFNAHYIESRHRLMTFAGWAVNNNSDTFGNVDGFDLNTNTFDPAGTWPTCPITGVAYAVARDPRTDDIYVAGNNSFYKWTNGSNSWASFTPSPSAGAWEFKNAIVDVWRNKLVTVNGPLISVDLTTLAKTSVAFTGAYTGPTADDYSTTVHDLDNNRYLTIQTATLYAIDPESAVTTALVTVPAPTQGVNGRLQYHQGLGCITYQPNFTSNINFMPTR